MVFYKKILICGFAAISLIQVSIAADKLDVPEEKKYVKAVLTSSQVAAQFVESYTPSCAKRAVSTIAGVGNAVLATQAVQNMIEAVGPKVEGLVTRVSNRYQQAASLYESEKEKIANFRFPEIIIPIPTRESLLALPKELLVYSLEGALNGLKRVVVYLDPSKAESEKKKD